MAHGLPLKSHWPSSLVTNWHAWHSPRWMRLRIGLRQRSSGSPPGRSSSGKRHHWSGFARSLRKAGRLAQAKSVLEPLASQPDVLSMVIVEMATSNWNSATIVQRRTGSIEPQPASLTDEDTLTAAAIALSMLGETIASDGVITWMFDKRGERSLVDDLKTHLAVNPQDATAAAQLQKSVQQMAAQSSAESPYEAALQQAAAQLQARIAGQAAVSAALQRLPRPPGGCGGIRRPHVFPRPRNLRAEPMRLVSTPNGVPTPEDVRAVIKLGVPGTSMVALDTLSEQELDLLVEVVLQMRREGVREQYLARLQADEEEPEEEDVSEVVQLHTTPGEVVAVPDLGRADPESLTLGKQLYAQQACPSCHGETGTGDQTMPLFDTAGRPDFPRDLVHDVFKGGNQPDAIYRRILLGMPGTPHPANISMTTPQLIALAHYCHSLGQQPKRTLTNHRRPFKPRGARPSNGFPHRREHRRTLPDAASAKGLGQAPSQRASKRP